MAENKTDGRTSNRKKGPMVVEAIVVEAPGAEVTAADSAVAEGPSLVERGNVRQPIQYRKTQYRKIQYRKKKRKRNDHEFFFFVFCLLCTFSVSAVHGCFLYFYLDLPVRLCTKNFRSCYERRR